MLTFRTQLKQVFRRLGRSPVFTLITLATLSIGIGANTAIFSVINGILLKPLPFPEPERLVSVWQTAPGINIKSLNASPSSYFTYREEGRTFEDIGLWRTGSESITGIGEPEHVDSLVVTDGVLPMLGIQAIRGRVFTRADDTPGTPETVLLTYGYWQRRFGGDANAVGRRLVVDGKARDIIGVLPRDFRFMDVRPAVVLPMRFNRAEVFVGNFGYQAIARLKPGATIAQANADVARMIPMMASKFPPAPGMSMEMMNKARLGPDVRPLRSDVVGDIGNVLWILMATVGFVLFIACANVANLLLVRAEGRQQELAIRTALGAGWSGIARELLLESATLGVLGGLLGLGVAWGALRLLIRFAPAGLPRVDEISIDGTVLAFTLGTSLFAGLLFGLVPVFKFAGPHLVNSLREGGRTLSQSRQRHRMRNALVVIQVALALILLTGSGLMFRTMQAMKRVHPGFTQPDQILTLRIGVPEAQIAEPERVARLYEEIERKLEAVPGVSSVAAVSSVTMDGNDNNDPIFLEDRPEMNDQIPPIRRYKHISPGAFHTMGNTILAGRDFTWTDIYEKRPVVLLSENLAREYWHDPASALGKRVRESPKGEWREVIGVAGNERDDGVDKPAPAVVYWPLMVRNFWGAPVRIQRGVAFVIRSPRAGSSELLKQAQQAVWSVNPSLPVADVRTVQQILNRSMARSAFTLVMLAIAAAVALVLGLVGIYGVVSYMVTHRTREIGIRMALGATGNRVRRMFVLQGLGLAGAGVGCGLAGAFALTRLMEKLLFETSPLDPATFMVVPALLVGATWLATYLPARRATLIEPVEALRFE